MTLLALKCRCEQPRAVARMVDARIDDATRRWDPTGTFSLRAKFRQDMDRRWEKLRRAAAGMIDHNQVLGLGGQNVQSIGLAIIGGDRVRAFQRWIDDALNHIVLNGNGAWMIPYIQKAADMARLRAEKLTGIETLPNSTRVQLHASLAVVELQGVMEATSQQAVRAFADGVLASQPPSKVARNVAAVINAIGRTRGRMVTQHQVIKTFSSVTLETFRLGGVRRVGITPERLRVRRGPHGISKLDEFNPDEPRAPDGKWTGGGGSINAYHGTSSYAVSKILSHGLSVKQAGKNYKGGSIEGGSFYEGDRGKAVFVANTEKAAYLYAQESKGDPIVLKLQVPRSEWKKFNADEEDKHGAYTTKSIPAKWIRQATLYNKKDRTRQVIFHRDASEDLITVYVVIDRDYIGDEFNPDEPRDKSGQWTTEGGSVGDLEKHTNMRDYTPKELDWEYHREYLVYSKSRAPYAFNSREDFQKQYDAAPLVHLSSDQLKHLGNSIAYTGKGRGEQWVYDTFGQRRDTSRILNDLKTGRTAPPIVLKIGDKLHLMAGQTRLGAGLALKRSVPVKLITVRTKHKDGVHHDAPRNRAQPKGEGGKFRQYASPASAKEIDKIQQREEIIAGLGEVDVLTAGDDNVCQECEDISNDGPYDIDTAEGLIPAHINCRCAFVPTDDERFAEVETEDEFDPDEPRASAGTPEGGQWTSEGGGGAGGGKPAGSTFKYGGVEYSKTDFTKPVKGTSAERQLLRKELDTTSYSDKETKGKLQQRVVDSFYKQYQAVGKGTVKSGKLEARINKYSKMWGIKNPLGEHHVSTKIEPPKGVIIQAAPDLTTGEKPGPKPSGYTPEQEAAFKDLVAIAGNNVAKTYTSYATQRQGKYAGMTPQEAAFIVGYTGNMYVELNKSLRKGSMSESHWKGVNRLNSALDRMPVHTGTVYRKASFHGDQASLYVPGHVVEERGFTSSSKSSGKWSGDWHFEITSKTGRDVSSVSMHQHEKEILFKSGTRFKVKHKTGHTIVMEEV